MTSIDSDTNTTLRHAITFYVSFDTSTDADFGDGDRRLWSLADDPAEKGKKVVRLGYDQSVIRVVPNGGISGGALEFRGRAADGAFVFFPAGGKLAVRPGGWGGAVSLWFKADLPKISEAGPWDPFLLVEKGWNDGAVWCDFAPGAAPRDLRIGLFPTIPSPQVPPSLEEGEKILTRVKTPPVTSNAWHHIVQTWDNFDTGRPDAWTACYLDGKLVGRIDGRVGTMTWNLDRVRLHIGSALIGMIDEVAMFNRPLAEDEIMRLNREPGVINGVK